MEWVANFIADFGTTAMKRGLDDTTSKAAWYLWEIGTWSVAKENDALTGEVVAGLERIGQQAGGEVVEVAYQELRREIDRE